MSFEQMKNNQNNIMDMDAFVELSEAESAAVTGGADLVDGVCFGLGFIPGIGLLSAVACETGKGLANLGGDIGDWNGQNPGVGSRINVL